MIRDLIKKHAKYASYVARHKWYVFRECVRLGIPLRGLVHDWHKMLPDEWFPYVEYFYGPKDADGRDAEFDLAWLRHQKRAKHHWQWWVLPEDNGGVKVLPMPDRYRREMLADWRGAGKAQGYGDNTPEWYGKNKDRMVLHQETREWIEFMLELQAMRSTKGGA